MYMACVANSFLVGETGRGRVGGRKGRDEVVVEGPKTAEWDDDPFEIRSELRRGRM